MDHLYKFATVLATVLDISALYMSLYTSNVASVTEALKQIPISWN